MRKIITILLLFITSLAYSQDIKPIDPINFKNLQSPSFSYYLLDSSVWIYKGSAYQWTKLASERKVQYLIDSLANKFEHVQYCPVTMTVNRGTLNQGSVSDLCAVGGTDVIIQELNGSDPLRVTFGFTGIERIDGIAFFGQYAGGASHVTSVEIYNYITTQWDFKGQFSTSTDKQWYGFAIFTPNAYIDNGNVQVRLAHQDNGIPSHQLILDYFDVHYGGGGAGSTIGASSVTFSPTGNISSTNVQSAITELDSEKEPLLTKGDLTEDVTGLEFSNTRQVIGGATQLRLTEGYQIPTTALLNDIHAPGSDNQNLELGTVTTTTQPLNISGGTGVTLPAATTTTAGLFTATDKTKLDGIAANANNYTHPTGFTNQPTSALTGANVISQISVNNEGHVTGVTSRGLTPANISAEPSITAGTTSQYWRGDKTFQTLNTDAVTEGSNQYFTNARARSAISLTTTGNSGASTYNNGTGVLNVPNYTLAGLGGVPYTGATNTVNLGSQNFITTGTVQGNNLVYLTGNQTISDNKTFSDRTIFSSNISGAGISDYNIAAQPRGTIKILTSDFRPTNRPDGSNYVVGLHFSPLDVNSGYQAQLAVTSIATENAFKLRTTDAVGNWSAWRTLYHSGNLTPATIGAIPAHSISNNYLIKSNGLGGLSQSSITETGVEFTSTNRDYYLGSNTFIYNAAGVNATVWRNTANTGNLILAGGNTTAAGANITIYGGAHATLPNVFQLRQGATVSLYLDASRNLGVNTNAPTERADINGNLRVRSIGTTAASNILGVTSDGVLTTNAHSISDNYIIKSNGLGGLSQSNIYETGDLVSIAHVSPQYRLDVSGNFRVFRSDANLVALFQRTGSGGLGIGFGLGYSRLYSLNNYEIYTGGESSGTLRFNIIATTGYAGVGGITPTEQLDINGNARFRAIGTTAATNLLGATSDGVLTTNTSSLYIAPHSITNNYLIKSNGLGGLSQSILLQSGTSLGINSTTTTNTLTIEGTQAIRARFINNQGNIDIRGDASSIDMSRGAANYIRATTSGGSLYFTINGTGYNTPLLVLSSSDRVGIANIPSPTETLDVNGNARFRSIGTTATTTLLGVTANGTLTTNVTVTGGVSWLGSWNASTNTPTISDATGTNGNWYKVSVAGTQNLGSGNITFAVGDDVIHNGTVWQKFTTTVTEIDPIFTNHTTYNIANGTGFLKNNGSGTWSYDNSTYLTTETDPVVKAINGIIKSNGTTISAAVANTDYQSPITAGEALAFSANTMNIALQELTTGTPSLNTHWFPWVNSANNFHYRVGLTDLQGIAGYNAGKLQGYNISTTAPTMNYVLRWTGSAWTPSAEAATTNYWTQSSGGLYPATLSDELRIGQTTDLGAYQLQVNAPSVFRLRRDNTSQDLDFITIGTGTQPYFKITHDGSGGLVLASWNGISSFNSFLQIAAGAQTPQLPAGLILGTTAFSTSTAGSVRWNGTNFQGYNGSAWVNLDTQGGGLADPMTTRGDLIIRNSSNVTARLGRGSAGQLLYSNGTDIFWYSFGKADIGLGNVENTALSTWSGSTNITTLGTVTSGTWNAGTIAATRGGTGQTTYTTGDIIYSNATNSLAKRSIGSTGQVLTVSGGVPTWANPTPGNLTNTYIGVGDASNLLSGTASLKFESGAILRVGSSDAGIVRSSLFDMKFATPSAPATGYGSIYTRSDKVPYFQDSDGKESPLIDYKHAASIPMTSAGGTAVFPLTGIPNGTYVYEIDYSMLNTSGTIINTYKYKLSFRFASGSIAWQRSALISKDEYETGVTVSYIAAYDAGSTASIQIELTWDGNYGTVLANTNINRITYIP